MADTWRCGLFNGEQARNRDDDATDQQDHARKQHEVLAGLPAHFSAMQIDDQRVREDARGMLAPGAPRAAYPRRRSSNANGLCGQNSAWILRIRASFQRDNLRRRF